MLAYGVRARLIETGRRQHQRAVGERALEFSATDRLSPSRVSTLEIGDKDCELIPDILWCDAIAVLHSLGIVTFEYAINAAQGGEQRCSGRATSKMVVVSEWVGLVAAGQASANTLIAVHREGIGATTDHRRQQGAEVQLRTCANGSNCERAQCT